MKLLLFGLGFGLQFVLCHSQVCIPTWTPYRRSYSAGGANESSARQLQDCLARCERKNTCLAVDFNTNLDVYCWLHYNRNDLGGSSFKENAMDNVAQYRINRNCTDFGKGPECPPAWVQNRSVGSYNGEQVNYWTEYDCFTFCRYSNSCVAVDYNNKTKPPCWIHKDLNPNNAYTDSDGGVVQYRLNKTCPSVDNSTRFRIGRCVGQYFPTTGWCPPRTTIHINDSWFRVNPLCCYRNAEDAYPPDSLSLISFKILSYLDPSYVNEINSSCNGMSNCSSSIRAKNNSLVVSGQICSDGEIGTNYVSIEYQCISDGSTTPKDTTTNTAGATMAGTTIPGATIGGTTIPGTTITGTTIPGTTITGTTIPGTTIAGLATPGTATAASTVLTTTTTSSDVVKAASNDVTTNENSNALIIGLCVGLGVPLILIIIIVVVVLVRRRKRQWKQEPKESYPVDNYYYNSETAPRGVIPENEQNEISMAVDAF